MPSHGPLRRRQLQGSLWRVGPPACSAGQDTLFPWFECQKALAQFVGQGPFAQWCSMATQIAYVCRRHFRAVIAAPTYGACHSSANAMRRYELASMA